MKQTLRTGLQFEDYVALVAQFDNQLPMCSRSRLAPEPFAPDFLTGARFEDTCNNYRENYEKSIRRVHPNLEDSIISKRLPENFLYRPQNYTILSNYAETLSLLAASSLDAITCLCSQLDSPIRNSSLGFIPKLSSLGYENDLPRCVHMSYREAFEDGLGPERPLVSFVNFSLSPFLVLGPVLYLQRALYRAVVDRCQEVLDDLGKDIEEENCNGPASSLVDFEQIERTRIVILDTQDWADFALLIFGDNYSIDLLLTAAVRSLRMEDVYEAYENLCDSDDLPDLKDLVRDPELCPHSSFAMLNRAISGEKAFPDEQLMDKSHCILATHSTLGVSHKGFSSVRGGKVRQRFYGYLNPRLRYHVAPGHRKDLARTLSGTTALRPEWNQEDKIRLSPELVFEAMEVGHEDSVDSLLPTDHAAHDTNPTTGDSRSLVHLSETLNYLRAVSEHLLPGANEGHSVTRLGISLEIPIPNPTRRAKGLWQKHLYTPKLHKDERTHLPTVRIGRHISKMLMGREQPVDFIAHGSILKRKHHRQPRLSIPALKRRMLRIGVQATLFSAIEILFSDFARALADSQLVSVVLDLYDSFCALAYLIEEKDLQYEKSRNAAKTPEDNQTQIYDSRPSVLDDREVQCLVEYVRTLEQALHQRTRNSLRNLESSHSALDVRGRWSQLISAADSIVKAGVGLVRLVQNRGRSGRLKPDGRVSSITIITATPRPNLAEFIFGQAGAEPSADPLLASFFCSAIQINEEHLLRPRFLSSYLHEAGHILLRQYVGSVHNEVTGSLRRILAKDETMQELFAELLVYRLVFGHPMRTEEDSATQNRKAYICQRLTNFWLSDYSRDPNEKISLSRTFELLFRIYTVTSNSFHEIAGDVEEATKVPPQEFTAILESAVCEFICLVDELSEQYINLREIWENNACKEKVLPVFRRNFRKFYDAIKWCHSTVTSVEKTFVQRLDPDPTDKNCYKFRGEMWKSLCEGPRDALSRAGWAHSRGGRDRYIDSLYLIRVVLNSWATHSFKAEITGKNFGFAFRDPVEGSIFKTTNEKGGDLFLDRGKGGVFVTNDAAGRSEVFSLGVNVIKTFYDVSCILRSRRLQDLCLEFVGQSLRICETWVDILEQYQHMSKFVGEDFSSARDRIRLGLEKWTEFDQWPAFDQRHDSPEEYHQRRARAWIETWEIYIKFSNWFRSILNTYQSKTLIVVEEWISEAADLDDRFKNLVEDITVKRIARLKTRDLARERLWLRLKIDLLIRETKDLKIKQSEDLSSATIPLEFEFIGVIRDFLIDPDWQ